MRVLVWINSIIKTVMPRIVTTPITTAAAAILNHLRFVIEITFVSLATGAERFSKYP
jgi:hypothetical protein